MNLIEKGETIVAFRPEHLLPAAALPGKGAAVSVRFHVLNVEYLGAERILYGQAEGGRFDGQKIISRMAAHGIGLEEDSVHDFAVAERDLKFFDREKGTRTTRRTLT